MKTHELLPACKEHLLNLVQSGFVPRDVRSFGDLHDYVDANCLAGLCEDEVLDGFIQHFGGRDEHEGMPQSMLDFLNKTQSDLDLWIKSGGLTGGAK